MDTANAATQQEETPSSLWPLITFLFVILVGNIALFSLGGQPSGSSLALSVLWQVFIAGMMLGEWGVLCAITGMLSRRVLNGIGLGICVVVFTMIIPARMSERFFQGRFYFLHFVLAGSLPLLIFMRASGTALVRGSSQWPASRPALLDLINFTAVIAASIVMLRLPGSLSFEDGPTYGSEVPEAFEYAVVFLVSCIFVMPVTLAFFFAKNRNERRNRLTTFAILFVLGLTAVANAVGDALAISAFAMAITAAAIMCSGLIAIHSSGFRLRSINHQTASIDDDGKLSPNIPSRGQLFERMFGPVAFILAAMALNCDVGFIEAQRRWDEDAMQVLRKELGRSGGSYLDELGKIRELQAGREATVDEINRLLESIDREQLRVLSVADANITDETLPQLRLEGIDCLNLSGTAISDQGLQTLHSTPLYVLGLARTKVTIDGIVELLNLSPRISQLNVSNLGLTDSDMAKLSVSKVQALQLSGNPITDAGLAGLQGIRDLDLSDTRIDGSGLLALSGLWELNLDGTLVTDQTLSAIFAAHPNLAALSIRRTAITAASLPLFQNLRTISLGDCAITDEEIVGYRLAATTLRLSSEQFTGAILAHQLPSLVYLDLKNSRVTDESLRAVAKFPLHYISLANTEITDRGLHHLKHITFSDIDLSNTKVTAAGLVGAELHAKTMRIGFDQFSDDELSMLRRAYPRTKFRSTREDE